MQTLLFGKKKKHISVPEGYILIDNQSNPDQRVIFEDYRLSGELLYNSDKSLNLYTMKFDDINKEDLEGRSDGGPFVGEYCIVIRDIRAINYNESLTLSTDDIIKLDPDLDDFWSIVK